jgi:hypothetical protein
MLAPIFLALFGAGAVGWALAAARYGRLYRRCDLLRRRNMLLVRQLAASGALTPPALPTDRLTLHVLPGGRR